MSIANILGLHLGCKVRFEGTNGVVNARIEKVDSFEKIIVTDGSFQYYVDFKDCKLLLTPLDKITEEDKREFLKKFEVEFKHLTLEDGVLQIHKQVQRDLTIYECFWLASKGYDIGICPKEYKEIVQ